jgi:hypothetical protein
MTCERCGVQVEDPVTLCVACWDAGVDAGWVDKWGWMAKRDQLLVASYKDGLSSYEVAQKHGVSPRTVFRAIQRLSVI